MKISTLCVVLVIVAGCTTFHPKPLSPSQTAAAFAARTLDDPGLKAFLAGNLHREITPWPPQSWDFPLLTLVALYYQSDLDVARAQWGVAKAGVITAGQRPNPSVGFTPQFDANPSSGVSPWTLTLPLDIPLETAGKRGYRIAQAQQLSEAAHLQIATVAWQVRSRLRARLLDLYAARQGATLLQEQQAVQEEIVKLLEQRFAVGEASQSAVTQVHIALDQSRLALRTQQRQHAEARVRLAEALGIPVGALAGVALSFDVLEHSPLRLNLPPQEVQRQALLNRPDILGALAQYAASQSALQLAIAKQYPDIHLGPGYEFDQGDNKWSLGFSITLPVFNRNQGPIAEAEAHRTEAAAHLSALQAQVIGAIDRALAGYRGALHTLETADALLSSRQQAQQSTRAMFETGEADRLTLVSAQLELAASTLARVDALVKAQHALGLLEDAIQRPPRPLGSRFGDSRHRPTGDRGEPPMTLRRLAQFLVAIIVLAGIGAFLVWAFLEGRQESARERERERPVKAALRVSVQDHENVIALDEATQAQSGIVVASLEASSHQAELKAYGTVVDLADLIALRKDVATAQADVDKAQANLDVSRKEYERLQVLHADNRNISDKALQAATAAWHTDEANARAAQEARRSLEGTARQRWGSVLATWVFDASPAFDRLRQRQEVLLQITMPPDVSLASAPQTASIQAADGALIAARLVSPSPRTDPRIQGLSFFYLAPARPQGLLPGMNVLAYLPVGPQVQGVMVPTAAVVWWQGKAWVYVQKDPNHFVRHAISTEMPVPEGWFVGKGLSAGGSIVVRGAQLLLSEEFRAQIQVSE